MIDHEPPIKEPPVFIGTKAATYKTGEKSVAIGVKALPSCKHNVRNYFGNCMFCGDKKDVK